MRTATRTLGTLCLLLVACSLPSSDEPPEKVVPGTAVEVTPSATRQQELAAVSASLATCSELSTSTFLGNHALPLAPSITYDVGSAKGLSLIQASNLALAAPELADLKARGFVITERMRFPSFVQGYARIYAEDLPLYVSADSILFAVHRSYDAILEEVEVSAVAGELRSLLAGMRAQLATGAPSFASAEVRADADLYLAVASSLLGGAVEAPVAGASARRIDELVQKATAAQGAQDVVVFGHSRTLDFSQFAPRGHYNNSAALQRYFRAMMWLGRTELRIVETLPDGSQRFNRRQLEGAYALGALMGTVEQQRWKRIHDVVAAFVGEPDSMTVSHLPKLLADLGLADAAALAQLPDATVAQAVAAGGYGAQSIASQLIVNGTAGTLPLSSSFLLFGQAYVFDSHVFSNLTYSRVQGGRVPRMMPDPLDVAFAALDNDQAAALLQPELQKYGYAPDLCSMRVLADRFDDAFWGASLYTRWLGAIRALSPSATDVKNPGAAGLPTLMATEPWGRRILNAQLASWAELRHDTLLYAKQSYTDGAACEYPDAYVDPYPQFYAAVAALADRGVQLAAALDLPTAAGLHQRMGNYFGHLGAVARKLESMAQHQRTGAPFSADEMQFINETVSIQAMCGGEIASGWYPRLFFRMDKSTERDPTIADVHTQYTDEAGAEVGRVLHVGTGLPRLMVAAVETCNGPRAYVGLASSYFERVTENWQRLTDQEWDAELSRATPPDPEWMHDLVVR